MILLTESAGGRTNKPHRVELFRRPAAGLAVAAAIVMAALPTSAQLAAPGTATVAAAPPAPLTCVVPHDYARFDLPLSRTGRQIAAGLPVKIVAIGSSSTFGAGASSPYNSYPSRLAAELAQEFVDHEFTVVNRGVNGDIASGMIARLETGVIAERPDLVLWQVGTNSLLRGDPIQPHRSLLHSGIERLKAAGADIVLIDPQYAPRVLARPDHEIMLALLQETAQFEKVNLFRRFALMRHWHAVERLPFSAFLSPDELHMNDFSYGCLAHALRSAIAEGVIRPMTTAKAPKTQR